MENDMTCARVLAVIDAGPFADVSPAHMDACRKHTRHCATCGPAWEAVASLTTDLAALSQPAPPSHVAAAVRARIARIEQEPSTSANARRRRTAVPSTMSDRLVWVAMLLGLAVCVVILLSIPGRRINIFSPRLGTGGGFAMPTEVPQALLLVAALLLFVVGLFAPLRRRSG